MWKEPAAERPPGGATPPGRRLEPPEEGVPGAEPCGERRPSPAPRRRRSLPRPRLRADVEGGRFLGAEDRAGRERASSQGHGLPSHPGKRGGTMRAFSLGNRGPGRAHRRSRVCGGRSCEGRRRAIPAKNDGRRPSLFLLALRPSWNNSCLKPARTFSPDSQGLAGVRTVLLIPRRKILKIITATKRSKRPEFPGGLLRCGLRLGGPRGRAGAVSGRGGRGACVERPRCGVRQPDPPLPALRAPGHRCGRDSILRGMQMGL